MAKTPFGKKKRSDAAAAAGESPRALSAVSKLYDVDGDGVLNDAERALRELDTENEGRLSNQKVLQIMQQQLALQHQLFSMKRILIGLVAFTVILALSNLGTAFAAASLAKDTSVSPPQSMNDDVAPTLQDKDTHADLATISKGISIEASTVKVDSRRSLRSSGAHRRAQGASICPAGHTYQPLMGCYVNPRLAGMPCLISTTTATQCAAGLECREADFTTVVNANTGRCVNPNQSSNGYNIITIDADEETSGSGAESGTKDGEEGSEMENTDTTNAGGNADNSTEPAVPIDDELVPTVASDNVVPGIAVTDDSVINYISSFKAQRAWVACVKSTPATIEHVCFDTDSISILGCENSSRQPTATGPVYKFDNNVILDCSTGEAEGCRATGLKCSFANRLPDDENGQDPATPVTPAPTPPPPPCPANPTQVNMGTNEGANEKNICSRSCECKSGCCIARPWPQLAVCLPNAPNDFVSCMSV